MIRIGQSIFLLCGLICLVTSALAQTAPTDVHVKLVLANSQTTFRIGDEIKFFLEFTADRDGYQADTIADGTQPTTDTLKISPDSGAYHWLKETGGTTWGRDVLSFQKLSTTPTRVGLVLNDSIRIDRPGKYSATVTTRRVSALAKSMRDFPPPIT